MATELELWGEFNNLFPGIEDEDTRIDGLGTYGTIAARAGILPFLGHVNNIGFQKNPNKGAQWEVGSTQDFFDMDYTQVDYLWNMEYIPKDYGRFGEGDLAGYVLGYEPDVGTGDIVLSDQLGSFEMEAARRTTEGSGFYDGGLLQGCVVDNYARSYAENLHTVIAADGLAKTGDMNVALATPRVGDTIEDLAGTQLCRFHWEHTGFTFSVAGVTDLLSAFDWSASRNLTPHRAYNSRLTERPSAGQRVFTGTIGLKDVPGNTVLRDIFDESPCAAVDVGYIDYIEVLETKNADAEYCLTTLEDVWLVDAPETRVFRQGAGSPVVKAFDFQGQSIIMQTQP